MSAEFYKYATGKIKQEKQVSKENKKVKTKQTQETPALIRNLRTKK
jgi:hypothetical protein